MYLLFSAAEPGRNQSEDPAAVSVKGTAGTPPPKKRKQLEDEENQVCCIQLFQQLCFDSRQLCFGLVSASKRFSSCALAQYAFKRFSINGVRFLTVLQDDYLASSAQRPT